MFQMCGYKKAVCGSLIINLTFSVHLKVSTLSISVLSMTLVNTHVAVVIEKDITQYSAMFLFNVYKAIKV